MSGSRIKDISGQRFGALMVLRPDGTDRWGQYMWLCRCDCGKEHRAAGGKLRRTEVKSCGCQKSKLCADANVKHGAAKNRGKNLPPEYVAWERINSRCHSPSDSAFQYYGGRGIKICERWRDFAAFMADMGPKPSPKHSIDRIDVDGDYEPSNCRWATALQQGQNKRNNVNVTYNGETACLKEWSRRLGVKYMWLYARFVSKGIPLDQIVAGMRDAA